MDRNLGSFFCIWGVERLARDNTRQWLAHEQKEDPMLSFNLAEYAVSAELLNANVYVGYNLALFKGKFIMCIFS